MSGTIGNIGRAAAIVKSRDAVSWHTDVPLDKDMSLFGHWNPYSADKLQWINEQLRKDGYQAVP